MLRSYVLAPVILVIVLGFMGVEFGYAAQTQSDGKQTIAPSNSKQVPAPAKIDKKPQSTSCAKKAAVRKKKTHTKHAGSAKKRVTKSTVLSSSTGDPSSTGRTTADVDTILTEELVSYRPYDLWLALENPETYNTLVTQARLKKLRLSIVDSAYNYVGTPYVWGGTTPDGFDCSGFVRYVYEENGIRLSRTSREQARHGSTVSLSELRPGDLLFFNMNRRNRRPIDHVGLYLGEGHFIHAPSKKSRMIQVENLESSYYLPKIVEARRVVDHLR